MLADVVRRIITGIGSVVSSITTNTSVDGLAHSCGRKFGVCQNGVRWVVSRQGTTLRFHYSSNYGSSWGTDPTTISVMDVSQQAQDFAFFIDLDDFANLVCQDASGNLIYRRGTPNAGRTAWTWAAALILNDSLTHPDIVAHREGTGWVAHIVSWNGSTVYYHRVTTTSGGVSTGSQIKTFSLVNVGRPSIDFHHIGDGKTVKDGLPHIFFTWSKGTSGSSSGTRINKYSYSGGVWSQVQERTLGDGSKFMFSASHWMHCRFDGTRFVFIGWVRANIAGDNELVMFERDVADTTTVERVLLANPVAAVSALDYGGSVYNDLNDDFYIIGLNSDEAAGSRDLVYRKWTRSGLSLGSEVVLDTAVGNTPYVVAYPKVIDNRFEFAYLDGTSSPYSIVFQGVLA